MSRPFFSAAVLLVAAQFAPAQPSTSATPKFEVASVKRCTEDSGGRGGPGQNASPARLDLNCYTVRGLIQQAYVLYANGLPHPVASIRVMEIEGGPSWTASERYTIDAKAAGEPGSGLMNGPMLAELLEDRFELKLHRETRELPVYALAAAKNGLKLKPSAEGACMPNEFFNPAGRPARPAPGEKPRCIGPRLGRNGPNRTFEAQAVSFGDFCELLSDDVLFGLGRPVVDKTGIAGKFDIRFEFAGGPTARGARGGADAAGAQTTAPDSDGPTILDALQTLGLRLQPAKGPCDFLVIDHVERPSAN